jgi:spore coat protein U domain-containing protein, fimbrial subunit CupE1/2/3/6
MTMKRPHLILLIVAASLATGTAARAESLGARMEVTATVVANCRLVVPPLSFGTYDPLDGHSTQPADASTVISVTCTRNTGAAVSFDFGLNAAAESDRGMSGTSSEVLRYQIYRDAARSQVWSRGAEALQVVSRGISSSELLTVFGRIPPHQEVAPGAYSDLLTATVDF